VSAAQLTPLQPTTCGGAPPVVGLPGVDQVVADEGGSASRRYRDRQNNFSILLPWSWSVKQGRYDLELLVQPPLSSSGAELHVSVGVASQDLPASIELPLYYDTSLQLLQAKLPNAKVVGEGESFICDVPVRWVLINYFTNPEQQTLLWQHYFLSNNGKKAYALSATADAISFPSYRPLFESIVQSFREEYPNK
jgi:hypothetical protein